MRLFYDRLLHSGIQGLYSYIHQKGGCMNNFWIFLTASLAVIVMPGPDMIFVLTRGISGGSGRAVAAASGVGTGLLTHTLVAALGLSVLLQNSPALYTLIRVLGGCYLVYLGIASIRSREDMKVEGGVAFSHRQCFFQGYVSNVLNPKIVIFFLAFLPQFVIGQAADNRLQLAGMGLIFSVITIVLYSLVGLFSGRIGSRIGGNSRSFSAIRLISGMVLILLGLGVVLH